MNQEYEKLALFHLSDKDVGNLLQLLDDARSLLVGQEHHPFYQLLDDAIDHLFEEAHFREDLIKGE